MKLLPGILKGLCVEGPELRRTLLLTSCPSSASKKDAKDLEEGASTCDATLGDVDDRPKCALV